MVCNEEWLELEVALEETIWTIGLWPLRSKLVGDVYAGRVH